MMEVPDVDALMSGPLGAWLGEQATVREEAKQATWNRRYIVAGGVGVLAIFALILVGVEFDVVAWGAFMLGSFGLLWAEGPKKRAIRTVKVGINDAIAGSLGLQYSHDTDAGMPFQLAKSCKLLPSYDRARFEDRWSGHFRDIRFELHEATLEEQRGSGKNRHWVTVYQGVIMSIGYRRRFHGTTLLVRDNAHRGFFVGKKDSINVAGMHLEYAAMSHPDFEDKFDIYTTDQVEARHLIDPLYVERLIAVERAYRGEDVATIFHEGNIVVTLKTGNMFESGSIEAQDDRKRIGKTIAQFGRIAELARELNAREPVTGR